MQLSSSNQLWFSLALPVVEYALSLSVWKNIQSDGVHLVGTISATSRHLFHVSFAGTCIQNAKSSATLGLILAWNMAQALVYCNEVRRVSKTIADRQQQASSTHRYPVMHERERTTRCYHHHSSVSKRALLLLGQQPIRSMLVRLDPSVLLSSYHRYQNPKRIVVHHQLLQVRLSGGQLASTTSGQLRRKTASARRPNEPSRGHGFSSSSAAVGRVPGENVRAVRTFVRALTVKRRPVVPFSKRPSE